MSSTKRYVIRGNQFGYNDETFYVCGTRIDDIFDDETTARNKLRELQLKHIRGADLSEQEFFFDAGEKALAPLVAFVQQKAGVDILAGNEYVDSGMKLPHDMSDDDVLAFGEMAKMHAYKLAEFERESAFYVLCDVKTDKPFLLEDEYVTSLVYAETKDRLFDEQLGSVIEREMFNRKGTLESLSATPELLRGFIAQTPDISHNEKRQQLTLQYRCAPRSVVALNDLLKEDLFEVRAISVEEIRALEKELDANQVY